MIVWQSCLPYHGQPEPDALRVVLEHARHLLLLLVGDDGGRAEHHREQVDGGDGDEEEEGGLHQGALADGLAVEDRLACTLPV